MSCCSSPCSGSATALFLTNPILRNTYELPEGRLVLDTAVVLAATIVAILAGVRFSVEGRALDLLLAAGFFVAGVGTLAFSVAPVLGGSNQGAPEAWAAIGSRVLAATLIALAPLVPAPRIVARRQVLLAGSRCCSPRSSRSGCRCTASAPGSACSTGPAARARSS